MVEGEEAKSVKSMRSPMATLFTGGATGCAAPCTGTRAEGTSGTADTGTSGGPPPTQVVGNSGTADCI